MANGDTAAAAGMDVVPAAADARLGYDEINKTRDYVVTKGMPAVVTVARGGTGATTAAAARTALGFPTMTASAIADTLMTRGSGGRTNVGTPVDPTNAATKGYVDGAIGGKASLGADVSFGHIYSPAGRASPVVTSYVSAYFNSDGRLGIDPSAAKFKQDIAPHQWTLEQLLAIELISYRLIAAVDELGDDAPTLYGVTCEQLLEAGLAEFVVFDSSGAPLTVAYDKLSLVTLGAAQVLARQVADLSSRLGQIEARLNGETNA